MAPEDPPDEAVAPPTAPPSSGDRSRRAANVFIGLFLLYQVAMPLSYYLGGGGYDERFTWRMFSTLRLHRCSISVQERVGEEGALEEVPLIRELQVAWINMLKRYRPAVVRKVMARRCQREGVDEVRYARRCVDTDGTELPPRRLSMRCDSGTLRDLEAAP